MSTAFRAFRIHLVDKRIDARFEQVTLDDLTPGEVVIRVQWSDINYKDALAATGAGRILRKYPLIGGIDLAGTVIRSVHPSFRPGAEVIAHVRESLHHAGHHVNMHEVDAPATDPIGVGAEGVAVS